MSVITVVLSLVVVYTVVGLIFALAFVLRGISRIDDAAETSTFGFKLLVFPGCAALWPLLLNRWLDAGRGTAR